MVYTAIMINEGLELLVIGMGTVFAFLVLLVICMHLMGKAAGTIACLFPPDEEHPAPVATVAAGTAALTAAAATHPTTTKVAAAIAAAHRARH